MKHKSIAMKFIPNLDNAPKIVASGEGYMALKIQQIAEKNQIPIIKDPALADSLIKIPIDSEIPENLYKAVSVIFQFLFSLKK